MASIPIPAPPQVQQPPPAQPTMADRVGQMRQPDARQINADAVQQFQSEYQNLTQSLMKVVNMAKTLAPDMMGDLAKMAEIGQSIDSQMQQVVQKYQANQGAQTPQAPSSASPTDAPAAA